MDAAELKLKAQLCDKISRVMAAVENIEKDKRNEHFNYRYVSDEAVLKAVRAAMLKNKVLALPSHREHVESGDRTTVTIDYEWIDVETGYSIIKTVKGCGKDSQDKGVYKASTGGEKYFFLKSLQIPTGDDPEKEPKPPRRTPTQNPARPAQPPAAANATPAPRATANTEVATITPYSIVHDRIGNRWDIEDNEGVSYFCLVEAMVKDIESARATGKTVGVTFMKVKMGTKEERKIVAVRSSKATVGVGQ